MRNVRRKIATVMAGAILATVTIDSPTANATDNCYGSSCVGLDPANTTCANDAKSIASKDIPGYGLLEMRWSRSCNAGWARYTNYATLGGWIPNVAGVNHAYVSAWTDQGTQDSSGLARFGNVWWGRMVDFGRPEVCVGTRLYLEAVTSAPSGTTGPEPLDWVWGPCVR
jgi:hypothetical protein